MKNEPTKSCSQCKEEKPYSQFYRSNRTKTGRVSACKICLKKKRPYYDANRTKKTRRRKKVMGQYDLHVRVDNKVMDGIRFIAEQHNVTLSVVASAALERYVTEEIARAMRIRHRRQA